MMRGPELRRLRSAIRAGLRGPRARPLVFLLSVSSMAAGLLLLATYLLLVQNMRQVLDRFGGDLRLVAFLEPEISSQADRIAELRARLEVLPGVASLEFVNAEQALETLRDELGREASVLEGLEGNPLPASFQIHVAADARSPEAMHSLAGQLAGSGGVADVRYGEEWVAAYARILRALIWLGAGLGIFLVLALGTIVAGAVRLGVHARADESLVLLAMWYDSAWIAMS